MTKQCSELIEYMGKLKTDIKETVQELAECNEQSNEWGAWYVSQALVSLKQDLADVERLILDLVKPTTLVFISIEGGILEIHADQPLELVIIDYDLVAVGEEAISHGEYNIESTERIRERIEKETKEVSERMGEDE